MGPVEEILAEAPESVAIYQAMYTLETPGDVVKFWGSSTIKWEEFLEMRLALVY